MQNTRRNQTLESVKICLKAADDMYNNVNTRLEADQLKTATELELMTELDNTVDFVSRGLDSAEKEFQHIVANPPKEIEQIITDLKVGFSCLPVLIIQNTIQIQRPKQYTILAYN